MDSLDIAKYIDLTLLKPTATKDDIISLCDEAVKYGFVSVVVCPFYVPLAAKLLKSSSVKVGTVIGFPLGFSQSEVKRFEAEKALKDGARELDMVMNLGLFKSGDFNGVVEDIAGVVNVAKRFSPDILVKVIIETCYLSDDEKAKACSLVMHGGADFVKTSTGFASGGASVHDVKLLRSVVGEGFGVKAAGGIRDLKTALAMLDAGADRLGASAGVKIVEESLRS